LKPGLFAWLITKTNYNKSSTVITAQTTLKAQLIFTLLKWVFLPASRLPGTDAQSLDLLELLFHPFDPLVSLEASNSN
jgi:hypothetical protein